MSISLRMRLTIIIIGLAIGPTIVLGLIIGHRSFATIEQQSLVIQQGIAREVGSEIRVFLHAKADELEFLDRVFSLGTMDQESQRKIIANAIMSRDDYQEISLLDASGMERIRVSRSKAYTEDDLKSRLNSDEFFAPFSTGRIFFGPVHFDYRIREPLICVSVPLFNKRSGEVTSILVADLKFRSVWNLLLSRSMIDQQDIYVTDSEGVVVAHRNPSVVFRETALRLPSADGRATGLFGTESLMATKSIGLGTYAIVVVAEQSLSAALDLASHMIRVTVVVTVLVLAISLVLVVAVIRQSIDPIKSFAAIAKTIADGDYAKQSQIPRLKNELGELSQAFSTMVDALQQRDMVMQEQQHALQLAHDSLEKRVAARTADLAATNGRLLGEVKERERAEDALREQRDRAQLYFDAAGSMLMVLDQEGNVQLINKVGSEILDLPEEQIVGCNWFETFIPEKSRDEIKRVFDSLMADEAGPMEYQENSILSGSGEEKLIGWHNTLLYDSSGAAIGIVSSGVDLTQARILEEEQQKVQKLESVGVLAGGIAHDSNNILTAILGSISLARLEGNQGASLDETLSKAEAACWQLKGLNQQLLTFSKGGAPIKKLTPLADLILETCDLSLHGSNVVCEYALPTDLWAAEVDQSQLSQVLNNLMINAIQAMPNGGTIRVSAENHYLNSDIAEVLSPGKYIKIAVRDYGIGIPKENLKRIFDPYFTTKDHGSGLGLAISYSVIKGHDGYIMAESVVQRGSVFSLLLPASDQPLLDDKTIDVLHETHGGTILVMDDQKEVRTVLCRMIERLGYEVMSADEGEMAVEIYKKAMHSGKPFDAVILDLTVPGGLGGKETMERLRGIDPNVVGIVSSGYSNDQIMSEYTKHGFRGVIAKPFDIQELGNVLRKVII